MHTHTPSNHPVTLLADTTTQLTHSPHAICLRHATMHDKDFVIGLVETNMRSYIENIFATSEQVDTYMRVNKTFDPEHTLIIETNKHKPIGRISLSLEYFGNYPAIVIHQMQISQSYKKAEQLTDVGFFVDMLCMGIQGTLDSSLPVLFHIIEDNPRESIYTNDLRSKLFKDVTDLVGMSGGCRRVYGCFPDGSDPRNFSFANKRNKLELQGIFSKQSSQSNTELDLHKIIHRTSTMLSSYIIQSQSKKRQVIDFHHPDTLKNIFNYAIDSHGVGDEELFEVLQKVLDLSVATQHPRFFNQLYAGADIYSIIAERCTAALNTSMSTYEIAPLFTLMEEYVYGKIALMLGWVGTYDGMMLPGGSHANLMAMQFARYAYDPSIHNQGLYKKAPMYILTSDQSHYSITKSAMLMGLGQQAVVSIPTNKRGEMNIDNLEKTISDIQKKGGVICMINATAGTTVMGAYDDIVNIATIAKKYNIRLHVDATRGGAVMFDKTLGHKLSGIDQADSVSRNPHKMMGATLQTSILITQRPDIASTCNTLSMQYLFNDDKGYDIDCDTGDKYTQCGRKVDILNLRLMRKAHGDNGIANRVRQAFDQTQQLVNHIQDSRHLYLYHKPSCTNTNFWYIPTSLTLPYPDASYKDTTKHQANLEYIQIHHNIIHPLTAAIKDRMLQKGEMMTSYTHTKGFPNFFRMVLMSPHVTDEDLVFVVSHIQTLGLEIEHDG